MTAQDIAEGARASAALFRLEHRGVLEVRGSDRVRWLNGMVSNDVEALAEGPEHSGCYATLLTPKGRIVADLHVLERGDRFWLELEADAVEAVRERLDRYVIADDVELENRNASLARLGIEGPMAEAILAAAAGGFAPLADHACVEVVLAGRPVVVASYGWSGEPAFQLFVARDGARALSDCLSASAAELGHDLLAGTADSLEILRVEAGEPRLGFELDEDVLPDEARLERAISTTKGCYTGQEIVARLRSRGQVNHLLVGLRFRDAVLPALGTSLEIGGKRSGEVTSAVLSAREGAIGLGFVRRAHAEPGAQLGLGDSGGPAAEVVALPIVGARG